jgi:DNA replication protein DnaC
MTEHDDIKRKLRDLGLYGLLARWGEISTKPWLSEVIGIEEQERQRRGLERRLRNAKIGNAKPMSDFDWSWPRKVDQEAINELFSLGFVEAGQNAILLGPNGVGKTMVIKNIAHHAIVQGHTVRFATASDMLSDLAGQESTVAMTRRLRRYVWPKLLCIDEVGYLSYDNRYADLLFEVVTRRYEAGKAIILSTNKVFDEWSEVFPHAACVVTLVDRLIHRAELIEIDGDSYRLKEAKESAAKRARKRRSRKKS